MNQALTETAPFLIRRNRSRDIPEDFRPSHRDVVRFIENCDNLCPALDQCVRWRGHFNGRVRPYAQFWFRGRNRAARKLVWLWFGDGEVPKNLDRLVLKTTCPSHTCVNPTHLKRCSGRRKKPLRFRRDGRRRRQPAKT